MQIQYSFASLVPLSTTPLPSRQLEEVPDTNTVTSARCLITEQIKASPAGYGFHWILRFFYTKHAEK